MKWYRKYKNKLFITYLLIVLFLVPFFVVYFQNSYTEIYKEKSEENIQQLVNDIQQDVENYFFEMDRTSIQLITNNEIKKNLAYEDEELSPSELLARRVVLEENMLNVISPLFEIRQVNIFNSYEFYSVGLSTISYNKVEELKRRIIEEWLEMNIENEAVISGVHMNPWSENETKVISLYRIWRMNQIDHVVEVQREHREFEEMLDMGNINQKQLVYVMNGNHDILYSSFPDEGSDNKNQFFVEELIGFEGEETSIIQLEDYYYKMIATENYGIKFLVAQPLDELMGYYYQQRRDLFIVVVVIVLFLLCASWYLSRSMTKSLDHIKEEMNQLTIENMQCVYEQSVGELDEMSQVYKVFQEMNQRLAQSIEELLLSQQMEFKAKRAALQSQIAPHFIGNTLTIIGAKGYEHGIEEIDEMCVILSEMMVYITKQSELNTTIGKELYYIEQYLRLIQYRYEERITYEIELDEELEHISVPMLFMQPLVENSILHGYGTKIQQLHIRIKVKKDGKRWYANIEDNGVGFSKEAINSFEYLCQLFDKDNDIFTRKELNVGLFNAYLRLKLYYKENTIWEIQSQYGKTRIIIGGNCDV